MSQSRTCTVEMIYNGKSTRITCPAVTKYEVFVKIAMKRFSIPVEFIDFIQVSSGHQYIFDKDTFENYILLFPEPEISFKITVKYDLLLQDLELLGFNASEPSSTCNKRRSCDEDNEEGERAQDMSFSAPTTKYDSDEPIVKMPRIEYSSEPSNVRISGKSNRILERSMITGR